MSSSSEADDETLVQFMVEDSSDESSIDNLIVTMSNKSESEDGGDNDDEEDVEDEEDEEDEENEEDEEEEEEENIDDDDNKKLSKKSHVKAEIVIETKHKRKRSNRLDKNSTKKLKTIPRVKSLGIPFRAIKRAMKINKDIGTVQNEAAIITTYAVELFIRKLARESHDIARRKRRNTVRYEDIGEVRANNSNLNFLSTLIP